MKVTATLGRYLAVTYLYNTLLLLAALLAIVYLFDTIELLRRASKFADVSVGLVLQMGLLKLPDTGQTLFPFAVLFGAMYTFWQMTRRYELVVMRAAGFSVWQFLSPVLAVAVLLGCLHMMVINPAGSVLLGKFSQLENLYLKRDKDSQIALFREGLWLRQGTPEGYVILHAPKITQPDWALKGPSVFFFSGDDKFLRRIDAASAKLENERWIFRRVSMYESGKAATQDTFVLPTTLTQDDVENSFSSPAAMSFWQLPAHIQTLEETGFNSARLRVHYNSLLAQPLMFAAMVLLAAAVSLRPPRERGVLFLIAAGIVLGFMIFFFSSFLQALGGTLQVPVILAAWAPALVSFLLGVTVMMNLEDG